MAEASTPPRLPHSRLLTIVAQDPSVRVGGRILTAEVSVPAEELAPGPCGYRVKVIDYDVASNVLYKPAIIPPAPAIGEPPAPNPPARPIPEDSAFHAQNVYAIVMRTLARFEFALGRRVAWGCEGHQLNVAPHAFADANAFYSREHRGLFFGYFTGASGETIYACLSHDVVAHETTHAILDGLRSRYLEPSSPDQAAFHEGFSDIVALLSVFSLPGVVAAVLDDKGGRLIDKRHLTRKALQTSLLGLAEEMGEQFTGVRGEALRRSLELKPDPSRINDEEFLEPHRRGELLVASVMNGFLDIWLSRLERVGFIQNGQRDRQLVVEEGARVADHLLTMVIRAIDYCPPTDLTFADYLSALLTIDREIVPDDSKYGYREALKTNFARFGIQPAAGSGPDGAWTYCDRELVYGRTRFDSMLRDSEEVFRFLWENRVALGVDGIGNLEVQSVRTCARIGPDGFILRETVAEYIQTLTLDVGELADTLGIQPPDGLAKWRRVRLLGGGALIFDEYGRLKHQIANHLARTDEDRRRQKERLAYLLATGFFDQKQDTASAFAAMHMARARTTEARR